MLMAGIPNHVYFIHRNLKHLIDLNVSMSVVFKHFFSFQTEILLWAIIPVPFSICQEAMGVKYHICND